MRMAVDPLTGLLRLVVALLLLAFAAPALAAEAGRPDPLDQLFAELKAAPNQEEANRISSLIWLYWTRPSEPELAQRMDAAMTARQLGDFPAAVELLDALVRDYPDYAEGWNQRATMHYLLGNLDASLADCARVLELEPRHFGALSGRALIYLQQGKRALALRDMAAALELHPFLNERRLFPELDQPMTRI